MEKSDDEEEEQVDPARQELEWAIHAKNHSRSRLALHVFGKIIQEDNATRDDIVYPAYKHKFQVSLRNIAMLNSSTIARNGVLNFSCGSRDSKANDISLPWNA